MYTQIALFLLCLSSFFAFAEEAEKGFSQAEPPAWVEPYDFPLTPIPIKPSQVNVQNLLLDTQKNWEEKTTYYHYAIKALTTAGIESISQISIDFSPSYQQLIVHQMRVIRNGQIFDHLEKSRHQLVQREDELERNLYRGALSLIYLLQDIREGDIVEYAFSLVGEHPLFSSHYSAITYFQRKSSTERISYRLLANPALSFTVDPVNISLEPTIKDLSPSLREWVWDMRETAAYSYEEDEPSWYNRVAQLHMSEYHNWQEIAQHFAPLYTLPSDFKKTASDEMLVLIQNWEKASIDPEERALMALRFVQDEVRYLGIEEGMGAFKPQDPGLTLQRRFGDCKDKTFLLHALLHLMDIPSRPVIVHAHNGKLLEKAIPSPLFFNHVILQMEIGDVPYWVDSTMHLQGGSLQKNFFPDYECGLVLDGITTGLTFFPKTTPEKPTGMETLLTLTSMESADLKITTTYHDAEADRWRRILEYNGENKIAESNLSKIQEFFGGASVNSPIEIVDNRKNNILILTESFHIPTRKSEEKTLIDLFSVTTKYYANSRVNPERASPCLLHYPLWIQEKIHVENPFNVWSPYEKTYTHEHASLLFQHSLKFQEKSADLYFELKHLQDHIPKEALRDYWDIMNTISRYSPIRFIVTNSKTAPNTTEGPFTISSLFLLLMAIGLLIPAKKHTIPNSLQSYLQHFQKYQCVLTLYCLVWIVPNSMEFLQCACVLILLWGLLVGRILLKKSLPLLFLAQTALVVEALIMPIIVGEMISYKTVFFLLPICLTAVFFGLRYLQQAKKLLLTHTQEATASP